MKLDIARIMSAGLSLALIAGAALLTMDPAGSSAATKPTDSERVRPVRVHPVEALTTGPRVRLSAVTRPTDRSRVSFAIGGRLLARPVAVGDRVESGQELARLDPEPLENAVAATRAQLADLDARIAQARRDEQRAARLAERGVVATQQAETATAGLRSLRANRRAARAQLAEARRQLGEVTLRAPFSGTVTAVLAEPGEVVGPGTPVALLSGDGGVEVELELPESLLPSVAEGDTVTVDLPRVGRLGLAGTVTAVGRAAAGPGRLFPVVVVLPDDADIRPGLTAEVLLETGEGSGLSVPVAAVIDPTGRGAHVLRVAGDTVERVPVETSVLVDDRVRVAGPLVAGELVVVAGHAQLLAGARVEIAP